jgi:hypothetical protein
MYAHPVDSAQHESVVLDTLAALHACGHGLAAYCPKCRRWVELNLRRLAERGYGERKVVTYRLRCMVCHNRGDVQLRPPVPTWSGYRQ